MLALSVAVFNLVSKSFNFLSPTTTSLVAAEADSVVGLERGVFTPPMAAVASSALAVALGGGAVIGAGMAACATPLLGALGVPQSSVLHAPGRAYLLARALGTPASLALLLFLIPAGLPTCLPCLPSFIPFVPFLLSYFGSFLPSFLP